MPAKVDAKGRRTVLVLAAAELIAERGIAGLTNENLAQRLGAASTTVVTHYFRSKRQLILHTYQTMASRARDRLEAAIVDSDDPLAACLHAMLPVDDATRVEWRVWLAFQGGAVGDPQLSAFWAERGRTAFERLGRLIADDQRTGRLPATRDCDVEARRLLALVQGMSFQAVVDPAQWPASLLIELLDTELARCRSDGDDRGPGNGQGPQPKHPRPRRRKG